jgi:hypothetical protein
MTPKNNCLGDQKTRSPMADASVLEKNDNDSDFRVLHRLSWRTAVNADMGVCQRADSVTERLGRCRKQTRPAGPSGAFGILRFHFVFLKKTSWQTSPTNIQILLHVSNENFEN